MGKKKAVIIKHTPGPWEACHDGKCSCGMVWSIPGDFPVAAALSVCRMWETYNLGTGLKPQSGELEANARLIAAAPELLAACKALMNAQEADEWSMAIDMGCAAVEKAKDMVKEK